MQESTKKKPDHIETAEGYKLVWNCALHNKTLRNANEALTDTICVAKRSRNFSSIEDLIQSHSRDNRFDPHLILSLGCGAGADLLKFRRLFPSSMIFGIDTSLDALFIAKRNLDGKNASLICASMDHLPFRNQMKFDMLVAGQSIDLKFEDKYLKKALTEITRYSSRKCRFYMSFYGTSENQLEQYKCDPIGKLLDKLDWTVSSGRRYRIRNRRYSKGVFWVCERSKS